MSAHQSAELSAVAEAEVRALLLRELRALVKIDGTLEAMSEAEGRTGVDIAAPFLDEIRWRIKSALTVIMREVGRVPA